MNPSSHPVRDLDDVVHQRTRLGVLAIVCEVKEADFSTIRSTLELTAGNLSQHLRVLDEAGLISIRKTSEGNRSRTWVRVTPAGRRAFKRELKALKDLIERHDL